MGGGAAGVPVESFIIIALCFWLLVFCIDQSKENKSNTDTMGYRGAWSGRHGAPCPSTRRGLWLAVQAPCGSAVDPPWVLSTSPLSPPLPTLSSAIPGTASTNRRACFIHPTGPSSDLTPKHLLCGPCLSWPRPAGAQLISFILSVRLSAYTMAIHSAPGKPENKRHLCPCRPHLPRLGPGHLIRRWPKVP